MSKTILCFPVILLSHASNSGLTDTSRAGRAAASSGATRPPRPSAAAPAAIRPRNPRRCVVRLTISGIQTLLACGGTGVSSGLRRIGDVRRCIAVRPIVDLVGKIRADMRVHVRRHVERLLIGQGARLIERHVVADERRGGARARHSRADVVRARAPYRRSHRGALAVRAVAFDAAGPVHPGARRRVGGEGGPSREPVGRPRWSDGHIARQEPQVGDDVPHVGAVGRERLAVHAAPEAVVDPVRERFDCGAAGPVLRVAREHAHPGAARAAAGVQMTARTPQPVADVRRQALRRRHEQRATAPDGDAQRTAGNERVRRAAQRLWRGNARAIRTTGTGEDDRGGQAQGREGVHRERIVSRFVAGRQFGLRRCNVSAPSHIPLSGAPPPRARAPFPFPPRSSMPPAWSLMLLFATNAIAAQQPPEVRADSARVARVLALLETSDSTVCELAAQAISNAWGWSWQPQLLPTPMPMPMPAPMPMPMMRKGHGPRARMHVNHRARWRGADSVAFGAFHAVLRDDNRCVRNIAARVLGRAGAPGSFDAFVALLRETAPGLRETGALGLGELKDRRALRPLQDALRDRDARVRAMAARAVGELADSGSVAVLAKALGDDATPVRQTAAWALGRLESPGALSALGGALKDTSPDVRRTAAWALGATEDRAAVDLLLPLLRDRDAPVRLAAVHALGQIESPRAVRDLGALVRDPSSDVRRAAIWALGQIEDPGAVAALSIALKDSDPRARQLAAWALGQIEAPDAIDALGGALKDREPDVRVAAAWALGQIESPRAVEPLKAALQDESQDVQDAAGWALDQIDDEGPVRVRVRPHVRKPI